MNFYFIIFKLRTYYNYNVDFTLSTCYGNNKSRVILHFEFIR